MKRLFIFLTAVFFTHVVSGQQNDAVVINPAKQNEEELFKRIYQYPQFTQGKASYKNGDVATSLLNYNYLSNQIIFIAPKGDTLELINGGNFSNIAVGTDTFYYYNKQFIQQITHYPAYNLLIKHSLQNNGSEKSGAYGTYSGTSAISPVNMVVDDRYGTIRLATDENISFVFKDYYYISGKYGQFYPATKKGIADLFGKNEKQLREFLDKNEINYSKKEDLEKLIVFARSVLK